MVRAQNERGLLQHLDDCTHGAVHEAAVLVDVLRQADPHTWREDHGATASLAVARHAVGRAAGPGVREILGDPALVEVGSGLPDRLSKPLCQS